MNTPQDAVADVDGDDERATVTAHCCTPDRTVFTERGNSDGWIATDLTVELER